MNLTKTIESIIDNSGLDHEEKISECARITAIYMTEVNAEHFSMKLGSYKVSVSIEHVGE